MSSMGYTLHPCISQSSYSSLKFKTRNPPFASNINITTLPSPPTTTTQQESYQIQILRSCISTPTVSVSVSKKTNNNDRQVQAFFIHLLRDCASSGSIQQGKALHGFLLKSNFIHENADETVVLYNHLAHMYGKCSKIDYARRLFDQMPERNVFSWTVMVVGSTENGFFLDGFKSFCQMQNHGVIPDKFVYTTVIQSCIGLKSVEFGKMVHAQIAKSEFSSHVFVNTSLLNMYAKLGYMEDAVRVFMSMNQRSQVTWNAMISGSASNDLNLEAYNWFLSMRSRGFGPNIYTFASVLKAIGKLGDVSKGREVHHHVIRSCLESNVVVGTALIDMYSKCGSFSEARTVFEKNFAKYSDTNMPWNAMISGYSQGGYSEEALEIFKRMCLNSVYTDLFTYGSVLHACVDLKCLRCGREVHGRVVKIGDDSRVLSVNNALIHVYSKCGCIEDATKVFERMEERDVVSWTTIITAYAHCSEEEKALDVFRQMREEENVRPNQFTYASVLVACASISLLELGCQVHSLVCKAGLGDDNCVEGALINMYAKCGSMVEAESVFMKIVSPDVVSWTAIIMGYAQHGFAENALQLFRKMEESGTKPNAITILCVLFACSHGGMVDQGLFYFHLMKERYRVAPEMEHYACVVDLLARVGHLDDAVAFINDMPIEPNEMVWQTLLAGCRVHGNVELGKAAAKKVISVRPEDSAAYVLLSNTYIDKGSLVDGHGLREVMKEKGVKKEPGVSTIVVGGTVHRFFAGDQRHPQKDYIYAKLEDLRERMKEMGYIPDVSSGLQDYGMRGGVVGLLSL
ncbi:hypothetical protein MRB53_011530 [Persea americana]|uniref:Uncharacterized protein n=1 Tax=Persea americana TaxID=3435 RepID=A0ACC2LVN0_PERAE|nr:hypothetical protein MRB53_011530 [Persea americana]